MRLIINALPLLGEDSGIGTYTRHIGSVVLNNRIDVTFFYGYLGKKLPPVSGSASWLTNLGGIARRGSICRRIGKKALAVINSIGNTFNPKIWDCYFEPNFILLPTIHALCKIITIHDFSCFRYPQWHPAERVEYMQRHFWNSVSHATHIITVSEAIRAEAQRMYNIPAERITAIPNGVDHTIFKPAQPQDIASLRQRHDLPDNFILYVGAIEPRKNIHNLIHAHSRLPTSLRNTFPLLIVGAPGWNNTDIMNLIHQQTTHVRLIGHVPLADLPLFYAAADVFAYPSWYEGFGLPVLEAMACGRAVLASDIPALTELCADAAMYAPPDDVAAMSLALRELLENTSLRHQLEAKAILRAQDFSWADSGNKHCKIFADIMATC